MAPPETKSPPSVAADEGPEASTGKGLNGKDSTRTVSDYSRRRYRLGTHVKSILRVQAMKTSPGRFPGDVYRTVDCTWVRIAELSMVRPMDRASYHYKGLVTCGNVWVCPICSAKIQERRRQEVEQAKCLLGRAPEYPAPLAITDVPQMPLAGGDREFAGDDPDQRTAIRR